MDRKVKQTFKNSLFRAFTILKYLFTVFIILLSYKTTRMCGYCIIGLAELAVVFLVSDYLLRKTRIWYLGNVILIFVINTQFVVLALGGTFVTSVMLDNLGAADMLRGRAAGYISAVVAVVLTSLFPVVPVLKKKIGFSRPLAALLALELCFTLAYGNQNFAFYSLFDTAKQKIASLNQEQELNERTIRTDLFFHPYIPQYRQKPDSLSENPNIVILFIEGMSEHLLTSYDDLMPNMKALEASSLSFSNYYNHTAATYRGIIGNLFSGYQMQNLDKNHLISLESILKDRGYHTGFINVEPGNMTFMEYLRSLGFDEIISRRDNSKNLDLIYDQEAFDILFDYIQEKGSAGTPFLTCLYTIGTHITFKSPGDVYGDGGSDLLNRFHYLDLCLGDFLQKFYASSLADNTVLIVSTDHCTYMNDEYLSLFDRGGRAPFVDSIPFMIWHKDIIPEQIDAVGRNSLDFVPTICDYLDISAVNYFLGSPLFATFGIEDNDYDTINCVDMEMVTTVDGVISPLNDSQKEILREHIADYYALARTS